jgi:hypothetical protein
MLLTLINKIISIFHYKELPVMRWYDFPREYCFCLLFFSCSHVTFLINR